MKCVEHAKREKREKEGKERKERRERKEHVAKEGCTDTTTHRQSQSCTKTNTQMDTLANTERQGHTQGSHIGTKTRSFIAFSSRCRFKSVASSLSPSPRPHNASRVIYRGQHITAWPFVFRDLILIVKPATNGRAPAPYSATHWS